MIDSKTPVYSKRGTLWGGMGLRIREFKEQVGVPSRNDQMEGGPGREAGGSISLGPPSIVSGTVPVYLNGLTSKVLTPGSPTCTDPNKQRTCPT